MQQIKGVEYRAIDAYGNNINNPEWVIPGAANLIEPINSFTDGIGEMNQNLPNPRDISNALFGSATVVPFHLFIMKIIEKMNKNQLKMISTGGSFVIK